MGVEEMEKKWIFCDECGQAMYIGTGMNDRSIRFCSERCLYDWVDGGHHIDIGFVSNFGEKKSSDYNRWKKLVSKRDKATCRCCRSKKKIQIHHIINWSKDLELRYEVSNGIALCSECHSMIHGFRVGTLLSISIDKEKVRKIRAIYIDKTKITYLK